VVTNFLFAMGKIAELSSVNRSLLIAEAANYL
jgi:hypothetical protein